MAKIQPAMVGAFESFWGEEGLAELLLLPSCSEVCFFPGLSMYGYTDSLEMTVSSV